MNQNRSALLLCLIVCVSMPVLALEPLEVLQRWKETIAANTSTLYAEHEISEELKYENSQRKARFTKIRQSYGLKEHMQAQQDERSISYEDNPGKVSTYASRDLVRKNPDEYISVSSASVDGPVEHVDYSTHPDSLHLESKFVVARRATEYAYTDYLPVWQILEESKGLTLRDKMEDVGGASCYVLEAQTPYGKYTVWLDPKCGYLWRRATVHKEGSDLQWGKPISDNQSTEDDPEMPYPMTGVASYDLEIRDVDIQERDGHFVIAAATEAYAEKHVTGEVVLETWTSKLLDIDFSPDFEALGTFDMKIPDGTPVRHLDVRDHKTKFVWRNGEPVIDATQDVAKMVRESVKELSQESGNVPASGKETLSPIDAKKEHGLTPEGEDRKAGSVTRVAWVLGIAAAVLVGLGVVLIRVRRT